MPYPYRDPDGDLRAMKTAGVEGRVPTEAEQKARWRREGGGTEPGMRPVWTRIRNGLPVLSPYRRRGDTAQATAAWQRVADIQAALRGEPPPPPVRKPWNQPPCEGCGYQMRCSCPEVPGD